MQYIRYRNLKISDGDVVRAGEIDIWKDLRKTEGTCIQCKHTGKELNMTSQNVHSGASTLITLMRWISEANQYFQLDTSNKSQTQGGADSPSPHSLMT